MDSQYTFPNAFHATSSSPHVSVSVPSPDFAFTHTMDASVPEFPGEFDMLRHSQHTHTHNNNGARPYIISHSSHPRPRLSPTTTTTTTTDFEFANSLRSVRGTRSSSSSSLAQGQAQGQEDEYGAAHGRGRPTESEAAVAETIVRARKSWKTVKGRSEPVWPPHLEKALVQALLQYKPHDSRYARALGRFPKRNRYISDFIFAATGVRRSPKQVGSRLQQLKDVSCGKMLLNHVASWSLAPPTGAASSSSSSSANDAPAPASPSASSYSSLHPDLGVISNDVHGRGHSHGSEGSQSPVSPLVGVRVPSGATTAALKPYNTNNNSNSGTHLAPHTQVQTQTRGYVSAPSSPFESPPLTPLVRTLDVFVPFDAEDADPSFCAGGGSGSRDEGTRSGGARAGEGGEGGRPLVRFGGCLARPETVFAPEPVDAQRRGMWMEPRATFTARDPIAAQSVARVWVDEGFTISSSSSSSLSPISPSNLGSCASSALMKGQGQGQGERERERTEKVQVHVHSQSLVCTQTPVARASAAQTTFYSVEKIELGRGSSQGNWSGLGYGSGNVNGIGSGNGNGEDRECFAYATRLVDDAMWCAMRREGAGLSRYTVTQELMHSFDSPGTARGETFLVITYHFVPVPVSSFGTRSSLSPLSTHGHGHGYGHGRGSVSPVSSCSSSPISASPASLMHPHLTVHGFSAPHAQHTGRIQGHDSEQGSHGAPSHAYPQVHVQTHTRVPQLSIHPPPPPSISQTGVSANVYAQEGYYTIDDRNPALDSCEPFPEYSTGTGTGTGAGVDFGGLDMGNLHLGANMGMALDPHSLL